MGLFVDKDILFAKTRYWWGAGDVEWHPIFRMDLNLSDWAIQSHTWNKLNVVYGYLKERSWDRYLSL